MDVHLGLQIQIVFSSKMNSIYSTQLLPTAETHQSSLTGYLDGIWNAVSEKMTNVASYSFPNLAQSIILQSLKGLKIGELRIVTSAQDVFTFGDAGHGSPLKAELRIKRQSFWTRVLLSDDLGFSEAYMCGDVDCDDVSTFLKIIILNGQHIKSRSGASSLLAIPRLLTVARFTDDPLTARANISAHYDIDNEMFSAFLSPDMNYSSAIFRDYNEDLRDDNSYKLETLEEGQIRKMKNIIYQARIQAGDRVLEIGTGWGSFAILAAQITGCTIQTLTLSSEQKALAEEHIKAAGLSDKITVHLMDYRDLRRRIEWKNYFDRFISIEMMEHVGKSFFQTYWEIVDWALKEDVGIGCVQVTTLPEARVDRYDRGVDFIRKWIFPGCYIPNLTHLISTMTLGTQGRLTTDSVWNISSHYSRTLREWRRNFLSNFERIIAPALRARYNLSDYDLEIFRRKWCYYFEYSEAGFSTRRLGAHIILFTREGNPTFECTWNDYEKIDGIGSDEE